MKVWASILWVASWGMIHVAGQCVIPRGINDEGGVIFDFNFPPPPVGIFGASVQVALSTQPGLDSLETPIQMRSILGVITGVYSAMAAFEPSAREIFGRKDVSDARRRCSDNIDPILFQQHRQLTLAYAFLGFIAEFQPSTGAALAVVARNEWGVDVDICNTRNDCSDIATPWGLVQSILQDSREIYSKDGWNADGSLSSTFNRIPFADWRTFPYQPNPFCLTCWQPLLETDNLGFLFRQEHVVPHIGETATSYFLGDENVCRRKLDPPRYNYPKEAILALRRTAQLTDRTKAEVEFFDSKLTSIVPLQVQYFLRQGISLDSFEFVFADAVTIASIYESVVVAWREKVRTNLIRPTTWIQNNFGSRKVFSYLGPANQTSGFLLAREWQPYIRVMPHAEYPSGSSCLCEAFARAMILLTGSDDVTARLGGAPLAQDIAAGSSRIEQGRPATNLTLTYASWSAMSKACGQSRLNGGMHFTASVPDGEDLCRTIGDDVFNYFTALQRDETPASAIDTATLRVRQSRPCGQAKVKLPKGIRKKALKRKIAKRSSGRVGKKNGK